MPAEELISFYRDRLVCITGGAGFIGSHLAESLVELGANVRIIDDLSSGNQSNIAPFEDRVEFIKASILQHDALREAVAGCSVVFHQAALTSVPRSVESPQQYVDININGTVAVLEAARQAGAARVVYASSSSVYGDQPQSPKVETMYPQPLSPYAATKITGEHLLRSWCNCYNISGISLRYFNIFGPRQQVDSPYAAVIPKFVDAMRGGEPPTIFGDGMQTRDFTYIDNVVHANLLAGSVARKLVGQPVNIACGGEISLLELYEKMAAFFNFEQPPTFAPPRPGDILHSKADITQARELLQYQPRVDFDEGLARTLSWYQGHRTQLNATSGRS